VAGSTLLGIGYADGATGAVTGLSAGQIQIGRTDYGDTNMGGSVDGTDYSRIDNAYLHRLTGWWNGDFNYDGVVDGSDYALMDNAFNTQGASLAASVSTLITPQSPASHPGLRTLLPTTVFNWQEADESIVTGATAGDTHRKSPATALFASDPIQFVD
jgi:hypothetical protein